MDTKELDLTDRQFTQAELVKVVGIDPGRFQNWINRSQIGITPALRGGRGPGARRMYTALDVVHLAVVFELAKFGVPVNLASATAGMRAPLDAIGNQHAEHKHNAATYYWDDDQPDFPKEILHEKANPPLEKLKNAKAWFTVAIRDVEQEALAKLCEIVEGDPHSDGDD